MFFSLPILITIKIWLILQIVLGVLVFFLTVFLVSHINLNWQDKVEQDAVAEKKHNNFLFIGLPFSLVICVLYWQNINYFFYIQNSNQIYDFLLKISSIPFLPLAILGGSKILDNGCISKTKSKIIKSKNIENGNLHEVLQKSSLNDAGSPLIDYMYDGRQEYAMRLKNSDRGIILGVPGSGKTSLIVMQILDWIKSGQSIVLTDIKPEIYGILKALNVDEKFGYKIWVVNPLDPYADCYNIFSEAKSVADITEIISILMPPENNDSIVFNDGAKNILLGVMLRMQEKSLYLSLPNALDYIYNFDDIQELLKDLVQSEDRTVNKIGREILQSSENKNLFASVLNALSKAFNFLNTEVIRDSVSSNSDGFNLKEILMKPKQIVILQYEMQYKELTSSLFGATVAHIFRILQSNLNRKPVLILLDEIINSAPIPDFSGKLNTIRSMKMPTFLYLQSFEGLNRLYGNNAKTLFMDGCSFYAIFRCGSLETATSFSNMIGRCDVTHIVGGKSTSQSLSLNGKIGVGIGESSTESQHKDLIVEPNEFLNLDDNHAVILYQGRYQKLYLTKYWEYFDVRFDVEMIQKTRADFMS